MADAPDDKPRLNFRQRHPVLTVILMFVAAILLGPVFVESWRQWRISRAESEMREAHAEVIALYEREDDWPRWYRQRMPANWGGDKFYTWAASLRATTGEPPRRDASRHVWPLGPNPVHLDRDAAALVAASRLILPQVEDFFIYDSLAPLPEMAHGYAGSNFGEALFVVRLLCCHVCHDYADRPEDAWRNLWRLLHVLRRLHVVCQVQEHELLMEYEADAHNCFSRLAASGPIPVYMSDSLPFATRKPDTVAIMEGAGASYAQLQRYIEVQYPALADGGPTHESWFAWARNRNRWRDWHFHFDRPVEECKSQARQARTLAKAVALARREPASLRHPADYLWYASHKPDCYARYATARANAVWQLRETDTATAVVELSLLTTLEGWSITFAATADDADLLYGYEPWNEDQASLFVNRLPR